MDNFDRFILGGVLMFLIVMLFVAFEVNSRQQDLIDVNKEFIDLLLDKTDYLLEAEQCQ